MTRRNYAVDLETTANGGPDGDSPEAHWKINRVLQCGYDCNGTGIDIKEDVKTLCSDVQGDLDAGNEVWIIAQNAKFDIKYLLRDAPWVDWHKVRVWDTMTWEYRQSGHHTKFTSLEDLAFVYGIPFKKSLDLGALIAKGIKMEDIDKKDLADYLYDDVKVLSSIYYQQSLTLKEWDMDYILPLADMEVNGLVINRIKASKMMIGLASTVEEIERDFMSTIKQACEWQDGSPIVADDFSDQIGTKSKYIKPTAARTLSFLLTGSPATLNITPKWKVNYKKGFGAVYGLALPSVFKNESHLGYPVGEEVLSGLSDWMSEAALKHRGANKLLSTYVSPFLYVSALQGTIHPKLNTTVTNTGRLSSSAPNGQNMPEPARELCIPRDKRNEIVELDFSQLEVVAVACVSGDKQLLSDLLAGVDVHYKSGKKVFGWKTEADMTEKDRKIVKGVNFGLLYGGKAAGLSKQTGVDRKIVQDLIDSFYEQYPGVAKWQTDTFDAVCDGMYAFDIKDGEQRYASEYIEPFSGRKFLFVEQESPKWLKRKTGRSFSFSPQQTSNYPIQGFAGGDIVMYALTVLWRELYSDEVKFLMTVHDSIILEAEDVSYVRAAMDTAIKATVKRFNLPVELKYDVTTGKHWS